MRFGPLSNSGGERRLNVAITRAKCNVKLVGSILPSDIDLNRAKSDGVRMLRAYIEFARSNFTSASADNSDDEFIGHLDREEFNQAQVKAFSETTPEVPECNDCFYYTDCIMLKKCNIN